MALGATTAQVLTPVMSQGLERAIFGGALGLAGASALTPLLSAAFGPSLIAALREIRIALSSALREAPSSESLESVWRVYRIAPTQPSQPRAYRAVDCPCGVWLILLFRR